jgi:hypothetical protein
LLLLVEMPMLIAITTVHSAANRAIMEKIVAQKRRSIRRLTEQELMLVRRGDDPDPRLIELARLLARRAAREWYHHVAEERRPKRP